MSKKKRRLVKPQPLARYVLWLLGEVQQHGRRSKSKLMEAVSVIRNIEIIKQHERTVIKTNLDLAVLSLGGIKSSRFRPYDRSQIWGALDSLKYQDEQHQKLHSSTAQPATPMASDGQL